MGNYERVYGNDKLATQLNAKELILKKINADTNWVDIYTSAFMIGEDLNSIANLMLSSDIQRIIDGYNSSIFDKESPQSKISYLTELAKDKEPYSNIVQFLNRVNKAEEIRILGKMLKINQGIPTNVIDQFEYIRSIEDYINTQITKKLMKDHNDQAVEKKDKITYQDAIKQYWPNFSIIKFIRNDDYRASMIEEYEKAKEQFNILEVIYSVPHFKQMFAVLDTNSSVLNALSTRNKLENLVYNNFRQADKKGNVLPSTSLTKQQAQELKNLVDEHLINSWIFSRNLVVRIPIGGIDNNPSAFDLEIKNPNDIKKLRLYIEQFVIPKLKEKLVIEVNDDKKNKFIQMLTFGRTKEIVKYDRNSKTRIVEKPSEFYYKLPFNMMQIENTEKTRKEYESVLSDFNKLNGIILKEDGVDLLNMNIVDLFYLYNLIVNKDKFGVSSLTRIFEDVISTPGNEDLLIYDFNSWLDKQDAEILFESFVDSGKYKKLNKENQDVNPSKADGINPMVSEKHQTLMEDSNNEQNPEQTKDVYFYDRKQSNDLEYKIQSLNSPYLKVTYDSDLVNEDAYTRNAKGFIKDGIIYINVDRAGEDTLAHELGHIYLADAKLNNPTAYYNILTKVKQLPRWKEMRERLEYQNKRGSDFDEEVLAFMIGEYYKVNNDEDIELISEESDLLLEVVNLVSPEFSSFLNGEQLPPLNDSIFVNYKDSQKWATIKNKLIKDNVINEDCK